MKVKNYLLTLLAATSLMACSNDEENSVDQGTGKAWVGVSLTLTQPTETKVAGDVNSDGAEVAVKSISVYLQNEGTVAGYTKIADMDKFTNSGTLQYISQAIPVVGTVGETRKLLVIVNEPAGFTMPSDIDADGRMTYTIGHLSELLPVDGTAPDGIPMVNTEVVNATLQIDGYTASNSPVKVSVERLVAKAQLTEGMGLDRFDFDAFQPNGTSPGKFLAGTLKWKIKNSNLSMYLPKKAGEDPNMMLLLGDYYDYEAEPYLGNLVTIPFTLSGTVSETGYVDGVPTQIQYFTENFNDDYDYGNTTYISVQVAFIPYWWITDLKSNIEEKNWEAIIPATFYYNVNTNQYLNETAGKKAQEILGAKTILGPYTNGICYYNIPIGTKFPATDASELGAVRNTFYKANITKMIAPGEPGEPDPLKPVIKDKVFLAVEMTVAPWSSQDIGEIVLGE